MRYTLQALDPRRHLFGGWLEIDQPDPAGQRLALPNWIPGSYMIRDFARHVVALEAADDNGPVAVDKLDKATWHCAPCTGALVIRWQVYAWDGSVRAAALDDSGGFCNGSSVLLQPLGLNDGPFELTIERPTGPVCGHWRVATAMPATGVDVDGFGRYHAPDYEALIDHPIRFGVFTCLSFEVRGIPHEVVLCGAPRIDEERLCRDLTAVCEAHCALFDALPLERYVFFMNIIASGFGGLEHRASTVLEVARDALPLPGDAPGREPYLELLGLASHEYFHLWNVKRIRPAAFVPYDLSRERHTTLLWAFEGMTSYYDDLGLRRAGLLSTEDYLQRLGRLVTRVHRGSGRFRQTVSESSFDVWTRFYKQDENAPNAIVSYYAKGALIALALDLTIRWRTDGRQSLDDLMRALWQRHGAGHGVPEDGVERLATEITGLDLDAFFEQALRSTEDLDLAPLLAHVGVDLHWQPAAPVPGHVPQLGVSLYTAGETVRIARVLDDGAACIAGLAAGDRIVAIDGIAPTGHNIVTRLARLPQDRALTFHLLRGERLLERTVQLQPAPADEAVLTPATPADTALRQRRAAWLGGA